MSKLIQPSLYLPLMTMFPSGHDQALTQHFRLIRCLSGEDLRGMIEIEKQCIVKLGSLIFPRDTSLLWAEAIVEAGGFDYFLRLHLPIIDHSLGHLETF